MRKLLINVFLFSCSIALCGCIESNLEEVSSNIEVVCHRHVCNSIAVETVDRWPADGTERLYEVREPNFDNIYDDSLFVYFCGYTWTTSDDRYVKYKKAIYYPNNEWEKDNDNVIVEQLKDYITRSIPPQKKYLCVYAHYFLDELIYFDIKADKQLFGRPPGAVLNEYFNVYSFGGTNPGAFVPFFFTNDKALFPVKRKLDIPIDDFLAYRPLMPSVTALRLVDTPPEAPLDVKFTVTVNIKGKAPMSDTTCTIKIIK